MKTIGETVGGQGIVATEDLERADRNEFRIGPMYTKNIFPFGVTIGQRGDCLVSDLKNIIHVIPADPSFPHDVNCYNNTTIVKPNIETERYLVTSNPAGYGYFDTFDEAITRACDVLLAERKGYQVESELMKHLRKLAASRQELLDLSKSASEQAETDVPADTGA